MTGDALIHLRVPAATKGRWIRASRIAGMRLTDYITTAIETFMNTQTLTIPSTGYALDLSNLTAPLTPDEIYIIEQTTPEEFALAERYAGNASLWDEYVDPDATTDFDAASENERLVLALLVIGQNR